VSSAPYVARDPGPNRNISSVPPLRLFLILGAAAAALVLMAWVVLGALVGVAARQVPDSFEEKLGRLLAIESLQDEQWLGAREELQHIVDELASQLPPRDLRYHVVVHDDPVPNAFATPGGTIVIHSGLLEFAESENEVTMVLAHELAHHVHRDHLEGMGRSLVLAVVLNAVLGGNSGLDQLSGAGAQGLALKMSRDDERDADRLALLLLNGHYGHVGGAMDFFHRIGDQPGGRPATWLGTHPLSSDRVEQIRDEIARNSYAVRPTRPLRIPMP
jgi:predicted Zn-dependent protease